MGFRKTEAGTYYEKAGNTWTLFSGLKGCALLDMEWKDDGRKHMEGCEGTRDMRVSVRLSLPFVWIRIGNLFVGLFRDKLHI
jgi:hypothetical protein